MSLFDVNHILTFGPLHAYIIIFLIMIIEGPIITMSAAFAASSGYLNVWLILFLSFFADVVGDSLDYLIGYYGRKKLVKRYNHIFKIRKIALKKIERHFKNHLGKTLFILKMTPLALPGLILAGASKVPLKKYIKWCIIIIIPRAIFFTFIGYSFGILINSVLKFYKITEYFILALVIVVLGIYWVYRKLSDKIYKAI
ncbi:VTT domain-containing protein [Candidatus Pacearchaeota archaeon]|nr:VTT domain-containing protein [Candidatus Pacearchaeota archaeon]